MRLTLCLLTLLLVPPLARAEIVIVEGESFTPRDAKGWKVTHQDDSYGSHTYGGMWMTHGGCLGAPAESVDSVATRTVTIPTAGKYRVWSKYQAPPYYNYLHKVEIAQQGKVVFGHIYGKRKTDRLWSFSGVSDELWWPWGVDHDSAEAPPQLVELAAGPAEVRLLTVANAKPAGDRFVDFLVLTTNPANEYKGFKPYTVGSPFANEALDASQLFLRFKNTTGKPAQLTVRRNGHFQPQYGGGTGQYPAKAVEANQWSEWVNIGPFCRLVHDEGLFLTLPGAEEATVQFARDAQGKDLVGDLKVKSGAAAVVPIDITWKKGATVKTAEQHAREIIADSKTWRKANAGKKPKQILFYGAFSGDEPWVAELKASMGYNTGLPAGYEQVHRSQFHTHAFGLKEIETVAKGVKDPSKFRFMSFGDEIHLGQINYNDPKMEAKFRAWLQQKGVTKADLGIEPTAAKLTAPRSPQVEWYASLFNEEERFADYRANTELTKKLLGPEVLTGANYSPHHLALYYGPIYQWVDIFKQQGMSMFWAEDYIFSVPEAPQILSWTFAQIRCGVKYHKQPIHYYVMPHAPGQVPGYLRKSMLASIGFGTAHIDNFWVAPAERFTENYVGWHYRDTFRTLTEAIYDTAEVEPYQVGGQVRPARVAVVMSKATDFQEMRQQFPSSTDPFARECKNAPKELHQMLGRKDQQMLYLALRQAQHAVDAITEDDIVEGYLKNLDVVYFAGEWMDERIVAKLQAWVQAGGILYTSAGSGLRNQFGEPTKGILPLLGLKDAKQQKNMLVIRTQLELPLTPAIDTLTLDGAALDAIALKLQLVPEKAKVLGTWKDGSAAVTVHELGKGKVFTVGTLAGTTWMKTAVRQIPWARGGRHTVYSPVNFSTAATKLVRLGVEANPPPQAAVCSVDGVEAIVLDGKLGTLLTLVNWTDAPVKNLRVQVRLPQAPKHARSVTQQRNLAAEYANGVATFTIDVEDADYILLPRGKE